MNILKLEFEQLKNIDTALTEQIVNADIVCIQTVYFKVPDDPTWVEKVLNAFVLRAANRQITYRCSYIMFDPRLMPPAGQQQQSIYNFLRNLCLDPAVILQRIGDAFLSSIYKENDQYSVADLYRCNALLASQYNVTAIEYFLDNTEKYCVLLQELVAECASKGTIDAHPYFQNTMNIEQRIAYIKQEDMASKYGMLTLGFIAASIKLIENDQILLAEHSRILQDNKLHVAAIFLKLPYTADQLIELISRERTLYFDSKEYARLCAAGYEIQASVEDAIKNCLQNTDEQRKVIKHLGQYVMTDNEDARLDRLYLPGEIAPEETTELDFFRFIPDPDIYIDYVLENTLSDDLLGSAVNHFSYCLSENKKPAWNKFVAFVDVMFTLTVEYPRHRNAMYYGIVDINTLEKVGATPQQAYELLRSKNLLGNDNVQLWSANSNFAVEVRKNITVPDLHHSWAANQSNFTQKSVMHMQSLMESQEQSVRQLIAHMRVDTIFSLLIRLQQGDEFRFYIQLMTKINVQRLDATHIINKLLEVVQKFDADDRDQQLKIQKYMLWWLLVVLNFARDDLQIAAMQENQDLHHKLLAELGKFPDDDLRYKLTYQYFNICANAEMLAQLQRVIKGQSLYAVYAAMIFVNLQLDAQQEAVLQQQILPKINHVYSDGEALRTVLAAMLAMSTSKHLDANQCIAVATRVFAPVDVVLKTNIIEDHAELLMLQAKAIIAEETNNKPSAVVIVPCKDSATQQNNVVLSFIERGARRTLFANSTEKYAKLIPSLHKFIQKPKSALDKTMSMLPQFGLLPAHLDRHVSLWLAVKAITLNGVLAEFYQLLQNNGIEVAAHILKLKNLGLDLAELNIIDNITDNVLSKRNSNAFLAYAGAIKKFKEPAPINALNSLIDALTTPQAQGFYKLKYDLDSNPHMQKIIAADKCMAETWQKNVSISLNDIFFALAVVMPDAKQFNLQKYITDRIVRDRHLPNAEPYDMLHKFLSADAVQQGAIFSDLEETIKDITKHGKYLQQYQYMLGIMQLYNSTTDSNQALLGKICMLANNRDNHEFRHDLRFLANYYKNIDAVFDINQYEKHTLLFTDDYTSMLNMGSDVMGSCQRLEGNTSLNKCLLAFVTSPHVKLIAIVDESGKTIMRSVLRLCFDEQAQRPVAHLERVYYANGVAQRLHNYIYAFAEYLCAEMLHCDLVTSEPIAEEMPIYPNPVSVNYIPQNQAEYVDALFSAKTAPYAIVNAWQMTSYMQHKRLSSAMALLGPTTLQFVPRLGR